jgi:serine/threonine-protein kinase HipA
LEAAVKSFENEDEPKMKRLLALLVVPGSSLGGARPKANVMDQEKIYGLLNFLQKMIQLIRQRGNIWHTD